MAEQAGALPALGAQGIAVRQLQFFFVIDASGDMAGSKMDAVNHAMPEAIAAMRRAAEGHPGERVEVRAIRYGDGAQWHLLPATDVNDLEWVDIAADPLASPALGAALHLLAPALGSPPLPKRTKRPLILLVSAGHPADDWRSGLAELLAQPWGRKSVRLAIGIGGDVDMAVLHEFMGNDPESKPLQATDAPSFISYLKWEDEPLD